MQAVYSSVFAFISRLYMTSELFNCESETFSGFGGQLFVCDSGFIPPGYVRAFRPPSGHGPHALTLQL